MALKSYILTRDFNSPYVISTGLAHQPTKIKLKKFRKGEIVNGEMKHANNQPAFILVQGTLMIPLSVIKEVVTRDVNSSFDDGKSNKAAEDKKPAIVVTNSKMKSLDAMIIGAIAGLGGVILAEKQGWITSVDKKNKIYGAIVGAIAGLYVSYRFKK